MFNFVVFKALSPKVEGCAHVVNVSALKTQGPEHGIITEEE